MPSLFGVGECKKGKGEAQRLVTFVRAGADKSSREALRTDDEGDL
jgi:hypothetical protein